MAIVTKSVTVNPNGYSSGNSSFAGFNSSYPVGNANSNTSSTTYAYAQANTTASSTSYVSFLFDLSAIPNDATIVSVECKAKYKVQSTSRITSLSTQMYTGSTAKGSANTTRSTTASVLTITCGTWTRSELTNAMLRFTMVRGTNTSTSGVYVYGAELTVTYSYDEETFVVNVSASGSGSATPTSSEIVKGEECVITLVPMGEATMVVIDNGVDVSSSVVKKPSGGTLSAVIASYTTSGSISGTYYQSAVGKGSDASSTSNNNYCQTSGSTADINYAFNLSSIPSDATIKSVSCNVKGHLESTSASTEVARCQLYSGTTAKGSAVSFTSTSDSVISVDGGSSWTRSEIDSLILKFTIGYYGGNVSGATVSVVYEVEGSENAYIYTIGSVTENHTIAITFGQVVTHNVSLSIAKGTFITPTGSPVEVVEGSSLLVSFKGDDGEEFSSMQVNGILVTPTKEDIPSEVTLEYSTNYGTYSSYAFDNCHDGNTDSYFWSNEAQSTGKYVLITFSSAVKLTSFKTYSSNSTDMPKNNNVLQVSSNGDTWDTVGTFTNNATTEFTGINRDGVKYVRIYATSDVSNWLVLNEITIGYEVPSAGSTYSYTINSIMDDTVVVVVFGTSATGGYIKMNGAWREALAIYEKRNGAWVKISASEVDRTKKYKLSN